MTNKKYSQDRGWGWFINETFNNKKQKPQKKFIRATEIQSTVLLLNNFTEPTTEMQQAMNDQMSFNTATTIPALTTRLPNPETTTVYTTSITVVPSQLYSSKYGEGNTFDTNNIVKKYNKKQPMINSNVFRLINSLMKILPPT